MGGSLRNRIWGSCGIWCYISVENYFFRPLVGISNIQTLLKIQKLDVLSNGWKLNARHEGKKHFFGKV